MDVQAFNASLHFEIMIGWLKERKSYIPELSEMPKIGYVIYNDHYPIAMAFLRQVEGNIAQLDSLCTNPNSKSAERNDAIWVAVEEVIKACRALGIKHVMSFSTDAGIIERSARHGFKKVAESTLIALEVK